MWQLHFLVFLFGLPVEQVTSFILTPPRRTRFRFRFRLATHLRGLPSTCVEFFESRRKFFTVWPASVHKNLRLLASVANPPGPGLIYNGAQKIGRIWLAVSDIVTYCPSRRCGRGAWQDSVANKNREDGYERWIDGHLSLRHDWVMQVVLMGA